MKRRTLALMVGMVCLVTYVYGQDYHFKPKYSVKMDTLQGRLLLLQCSRARPQNVTAMWEIGPADQMRLEDNYKKVFRLTGQSCCVEGAKIRKINGYGYQYAGVVIAGKRFIYINAFPFKGNLKLFLKENQNRPYTVCDGGTSFWGVLFDVENKTFSELSFNGVG